MEPSFDLRRTAYILIALIFVQFACNLQTGADSPSAAPPTSGSSLPSDATDGACLNSGDQTDINSQLRGPGSVVWLCQGAVFELTGPVMINADRQQIATVGLPIDDRRAILRVTAASLTNAVNMRDYSSVVLSNIIIDGNRPELGPADGDALILAGGYASGQVIRYVKVFDTRSWSSLQLIQGGLPPEQPCQNAVVENNEVGPAGTSDNWADGISLACRDSIVRNNVVTDATDGGIVIFGAPGSLIENNVVRAETRTLLGGINMVDHGPYNGSYAGTIVRNNTIDAAGAVIRVGLAMGPRVWQCLPPASAEDTVHGAIVTGNTLMGPNMEYGFAISGVKDWIVTGNVDQAEHHGSPSKDCAGRVASPPSGFLYSPHHSQGTFQPEFQVASLDLALWAITVPQPGSDITFGATSATTPPNEGASAFIGAWTGTDPDDGSAMTLTITQNGNQLVAAFADAFSGENPPPGFEGSGNLVVLSDMASEVTLHLARHDGAKIDLIADLTLLDQNNTLHLDSEAGNWVFTRDQ